MKRNMIIDKKYFKTLSALIMILFLFTVACSTEKSDAEKNLDVCLQEQNNLRNQNNNLKEENTQLESQLQQCNKEKSTLLSSSNKAGLYDGYYDDKTHPTSTVIKAAAAKAITQLENQPWTETCTEYYNTGECKTVTANPPADLQPVWQYSVQTPEDDWQSEYYLKNIAAQYAWVRDNIQYVLGTGGSQTDLTTLSIRAGKCDEMSTLLTSMIISTGGTAKIAILPAINHAVAVATFEGFNKKLINVPTIHYEGKDWIILDPTCKKCQFGTITEQDQTSTYKIIP